MATILAQKERAERRRDVDRERRQLGSRGGSGEDYLQIVIKVTRKAR